MNVAIMARSLRGEFSGVVRYTDELVRALAPRLEGNLRVFVTRAPDGLGGLPLRRIRAPFPTPNEYARALWEQCVVPVQVGRMAPDVYHSPNYILPLAIRCPSIVTVHDMAFLDRSLHRLRSHLYLSLLTLLALRKAKRVVCVSGYTRDRLVERFPWTASKARVIGEGISSRFAPQAAPEVASFRARHGIERPYVLFVGTIEPRKNLPRLLRAFERVVLEEGVPHELVVAGGNGWKNDEVWATWNGSRVRERLRFAGYLDERELPAAYSGADVFAYPSLHEGFGLPPLEAMACGTPVLTSNTTALAEVAGTAAATVDPGDERALADELGRLLTDGDRRRVLADQGLDYTRRFRWDRVADEMMALYREAAG